jgi:hypothetical protein
VLERVAKKKSEFAKRFSGFGRRFGPVSENEEVEVDGGGKGGKKKKPPAAKKGNAGDVKHQNKKVVGRGGIHEMVNTTIRTSKIQLFKISQIR